jgi:hypothetical protein
MFISHTPVPCGIGGIQIGESGTVWSFFDACVLAVEMGPKLSDVPFSTGNEPGLSTEANPIRWQLVQKDPLFVTSTE